VALELTQLPNPVGITDTRYTAAIVMKGKTNVAIEIITNNNIIEQANLIT
jgi:hypothetical protein